MPLTSFYTALTGLNSNSLAINIIGDNLANMNTIGYKAGKASFAELLAGLSGTSSNGNPIVFGLGSTFNGITHATNQGTVSYTGKSTDAAINGNGFFVVSTDGGMGFTRSGKFEFDKDGGLVNSDGYPLMGYMAVNGQVDANGVPVPISIRKGQMMPANATSELSIPGNLDATSTSASATIQVYDSLGVAHNINVNFTGSGNGWHWSATIPAVDTGGASTDPAVEIGNGDLGFDGNGQLITPTANPSLAITGLASGAADMNIALGLLDSTGKSVITNFSNSSSTFTPAQNGSYASALKEINIDSSGIIVGVSEGGNTVRLAQLAIADFPNIEGLQKYKGSTFVSFPSAGDPSIGTAGAGGRGSVVGASLEQSNVDMAQEFVNLIAAQRAYQANSKIISATDELYQDSLNMKR
jgi:flagellar hook protein FlgE